MKWAEELEPVGQTVISRRSLLRMEWHRLKFWVNTFRYSMGKSEEVERTVEGSVEDGGQQMEEQGRAKLDLFESYVLGVLLQLYD